MWLPLAANAAICFLVLGEWRFKTPFIVLSHIFAVMFFLTADFANFPILLLMLAAPYFAKIIFDILEQNDIERGMVDFLSVLNSRLTVDDDIISALEHAKDIVSSKSIRRILSEFIVTTKVSCSPKLAFQKVGGLKHSYLRYVFLNIENVLESWGDARELVQSLENEYISVQTEVNKGRAELQNDKLMTYIGLFLVVITSYNVFSADAQMVRFYSERPFIAMILLAIGAVGALVLAKTKII